MRRNSRKLQNITINNGDGETTPLCWEKAMLIYGDNIIDQQSNSDVIINKNEWSHAWEMGKPRKATKNTSDDGDGATRRLC